MTNEEKILSMLTKMQADIDTLKKKLNVYDETPEEKKSRQMAAFKTFVNSTTDDEEPEATVEFFKIMDEEERKKNLLEILNKPLTPEEQKDADEFAEYIAKMDARKAAV